MVSLYNEPNKINDLIRAAHPYGGTNVVVVESPHGGEGRVEDSIEHQIRTLRMVYTEPTARVLADLASDLEKLGSSYSNKVDDILYDFIKRAQEPEMSVDPALVPPEEGMSMEVEQPPAATPDKSEKPRPKAPRFLTDEQRKSILRGQDKGWALAIAQEMANKAEQMRAAVTDELNTEIMNDSAIGEEAGHWDKAKRVNKQWEARVRYFQTIPKQWRNKDITMGNVKALAKTYATTIDKAYNGWASLQQDSASWWGLDKDIKDEQKYRGYFSKLYEFKKWADNIEKISENDNLAALGRTTGIKEAPEPVKSPIEIEEEEEGSVPASTKDIPAEKAPPDASGQPTSKKTAPVKKEEQTPREEAKSDKPPPIGLVKKIQEYIGAEQTGEYTQENHEALWKWLEAQEDDKNSKYSKSAAYILGNNIFNIQDSLQEQWSRLEAIHKALRGGPPKEHKAFTFSDITFTSPITGKEVRRMPLAQLINDGAQNPLGFIKALKSYGVLPNVPDSEIIEDGVMMNEVANAIVDNMVQRGVEERDASGMVLIFERIRRQAKQSLDDKQTIFDYAKIEYPEETAKMLTNPTAMRNFFNRMESFKLSENGWLKYSPQDMAVRAGFVGSLIDRSLSGLPTGKTEYKDPIRHGWPGEKERKGIGLLDLSPSERAQANSIAKHYAKKALEDPQQAQKYKKSAVVRIRNVNQQIGVSNAEAIFEQHFRDQQALSKQPKGKPGKTPYQAAPQEAKEIIDSMAVISLQHPQRLSAKLQSDLFLDAQEKGFKGTKEQFLYAVKVRARQIAPLLKATEEQQAPAAKPAAPAPAQQQTALLTPSPQGQQAYQTLSPGGKKVVDEMAASGRANAQSIADLTEQLNKMTTGGGDPRLRKSITPQMVAHMVQARGAEMRNKQMKDMMAKRKTPGSQVPQGAAKTVTPAASGTSIKRKEGPGTPAGTGPLQTGGGGPVDLGQKPKAEIKGKL